MDVALRKVGCAFARKTALPKARHPRGVRTPASLPSHAAGSSRRRSFRPQCASARTSSLSSAHKARDRDHYSTLGVPQSASHEDIKAAFRRLARQLHPDVAPAGTKAEEQFLIVLNAYQVLSDEGQRAVYDKELEQQLKPLPVYHDLVWEPVASAYKKPQPHAAKRASTQTVHQEPNHDSVFREANWKTRIHFRRPFATQSRQHGSAKESPYPGDWRQSRGGGATRAHRGGASTAAKEETASPKRPQGQHSSASAFAADMNDESWRGLWARSISSAVQYGEARRSPETRQESMTSYLQAAQTKLASCWPPTLSLVVDVLFVWMSMVLWSLYGTQATLAWLSVVMLTNPQGGLGHKVATCVAWVMGGEVGLTLVVAVHGTVWLAGQAHQYLAAVVACCLLVGQRLAALYPKLGSSAIGLFVTKLWNMCA